MRYLIFAVPVCCAVFFAALYADNRVLSNDSETCIGCHASVHPGIVKDWEGSTHSGKSAGSPERQGAGGKSSGPVVGCAECHTLNAGKHKDTFEHNGFKVHIVVTPEDCASCHAQETAQYGKNLMSNAYGNLRNNPVYMDMADSTNGVQAFTGDSFLLKKPDEKTEDDSCFYCHGTALKVTGVVKKETEMGEMSFPVLSGWPNHGVGRLNPDGSKGSCTPCHPRHSFSMEIARKPYTCSECHKGPDVPAYRVYEVSKHGNIFASKNRDWDFKASPWTVGRDFTAPTCAVCHVSRISDGDGKVVAERTHQMNDRLSWRIFGLVYAHPRPKSADTAIIKNKGGLPLPTELTGEPAAAYLIDAAEQNRRRGTMKGICLSCHSSGWVNGHFERFDNSIKTSNEMTLASTKLLLKAWESGAAAGPAKKDSMFNENIEKMWVEQWLFFANTARYASAMAGADYGVFADGRWSMSKNLQEMNDLLKLKTAKGSGPPDSKTRNTPVKTPVKK